MPALNQIYYIAGILEGEGCFTLNNSTPRIVLSMIDEDTVEKVSTIMFAKNRIYNYKNGGFGNNSIYQLVLSSTQAIEWMMTIYPLMSLRRKEQINKVLNLWKITKRATDIRCRHGHPFVTMYRDYKYDSNGTKMCLHCMRLKSKFGTLSHGLEMSNAYPK